ncbi:MAG TPA: FMN-binding protein [Anaerolineae bacterium]|nr:FMN-binding protein [Anaerolineae bacterium]
MAAKENAKGGAKGRSKLKGCAIVLLIPLVLLAVGAAIGWSFVAKEHREARSLPLNAVNFDRLKNDGVYHGLYEGGMYGWRYNECDVTVKDGRVTGIQLAGSTDPGAENTDYKMLYDRVIEIQSLQVDTISGATLTSKGWLQCIENALIQAQTG